MYGGATPHQSKAQHNTKSKGTQYMNNQKKARHFAFTDFSLSDKASIFNKYPDDIRALAWSLETCPTTGRQHHQGFIQTYGQSRFAKIKKMLGDSVHIETMRGTVLDNELYCEKEGRLTIMGQFTKQGKRTDIEGVKKLLQDGASMAEVMEKAPQIYLKYHAGLDKMKAMYDTANRSGIRDVVTTILVGKTGTGKTYSVLSKYPDAFIVDSSAPDAFPFNGYDGESVILIDDFNGWLKYTYLLRVLDKYKLSLNIKGGRTMAMWSKVFITTNVRPVYWYPKTHDTKNLQRRISSVIEVVSDNGLLGERIPRTKSWGFDKLGMSDYEGTAY